MTGRSAVEKFDLGASEAMANTEFSSGIYEAPQLSPESPPSFGNTRGVSLAGEPVDERRLAGSGTISKGPEGVGETPGRAADAKDDEAHSGKRNSGKKMKDTAGASSMIL
ncbi:hypothetical protein F4861DRAFT_487613 [Xylaria intraflava]|nr:hypothetical protein F4861DRAFT_487613 [Xylaria intraflava]